MTKGPVQGKKKKKEKALINAGKVIRLYSDPAVKVLKDYILNDFKDGEIDDLFGIYEGFIVLVETEGYSAREVIANTSILVRNFDPDITFTWTDLVGESMADFDQVILARVYNLAGQSEDNPLTIHVFDNLSAYLQLADEGKISKLKNIVKELREIHSIFILREEDLPLFAELFDRENSSIKIWLCKQPADLDLNYLDEADIGSWSERAVVDELIYTESAKLLVKKARQISELWGDDAIDAHSLLLAAAEGSETGLAIAQCLNISLDTLRHLRADREWKLIRDGEITGYPFDPSGIDVIKSAIKLASVEGFPDRTYPGLVTSYHLVCAIAMNGKIRFDLDIKRVFTFENALGKLAEWYYNKYISPSIDKGSNVYRFMFPYQGLHRELMGHVFGQNEALDMIFEYLCNDEISFGSHSKNNIPPATLLFSGPSGVGKAHLTSTLAHKLERPYMHLDLEVYDSVSPRPLLKFVQTNWKAILFFENVEKAHPAILKMICRILDHGKVYDEKMAREIDFYDTLVILSTSLPASEIHLVPRELSSRLKKEQIIPFNDLKPDDLINIIKRKFTNYAKTVETSCEKTLTYDPLIPYCLLFNEGGMPEARDVSSAVETLVGSQIQKFTNCLTPDSGEHLLADYGKIHFALSDPETLNRETRALFIPARPPRILLLAKNDVAEKLKEYSDSVLWVTAESLPELVKIVAADDKFDFVLFDLWFNLELLTDKINVLENFSTNRSSNVDRLPQPLLAQKFFGTENLQLINGLKRKMPIIMLNIIDLLWVKYNCEEEEQPVNAFIDLADELRKIRDRGLSYYPHEYGYFQSDYFLHFISSVGARGILHTSFDPQQRGNPGENLSIAAYIDEIVQRIHYEKMAGKLASHQKYLAYKPTWSTDSSGKLVLITLEDLQLLDS
jgi:hypothetical protein